MGAQALPRPERRRGFSPFPNDVLLDWPRLASGDAQVFTLMMLVSETLGAVRDRGTAPPYWSRPLTNEELAGFCRCTVRAIEIAISDLLTRKVLERKRGARGAWAYHIPFDQWAGLPDRPSKVVPISAETEEPDEEEDPEPIAAKGEVIAVFEKPQRIKGGSKPRPKELPKIASKLRLTSNHEVEYTATMCDGLLNLELVIPAPASGRTLGEGKRNEFRSGTSKSVKTQGSVDFELFQKVAGNAGLSRASHDIGLARKAWGALDAVSQIAALQGLQARQAAGEFDNPTYRPLPQNYLTKRTWEREIRKPAGKSDAKNQEVQRGYDRLMKRLRPRS